MGIFRKKGLLSSISKRKEELLDALVEEVLILDITYKIVYANQKFLENRSKSLNEVTGKYCYQITHNLDKPCHMSGESCPLNEAMKNQLPDKVIHSYEDKDKKRYFCTVKNEFMKDKFSLCKYCICNQ